jgi:hypothetical protein
MCDPVSAGLALSAGGTFLETREANKNAKRVQNAKNNAYEENMIRQQQYADEAGAQLKTSTEQQGREEFDKQKDVEADKFIKAFGDNRTQADTSVGLRSSTPKNVVLARQRASDEATAETDRDVGNLAGLKGYGGALFDSGLDRNKFSRAFGNIQDTAGRDMNLLSLDLQQAANNANKAPSLFPQLLKAGGTALGMYGAGGGAFSNTVEGALPASGIGPGAPVTSYGLFQNGAPMTAFGSQMVF